MARPENPIDPMAPYATFALQLRKLRKAAGSPTYSTLSRRTRYSVSALSQAATGWKLPSLDLTLAYATACGGDREHWNEQWLIAHHRTTPTAPEAPATAEVRPWSTRPPVPASAETPQEFIACLRELKLWAGNPSLSRLEGIASEMGFRLPRSTIGDALNRNRVSRPDLARTTALVLACMRFATRQRRVRAEEIAPVGAQWQQHWVRLYASEPPQRPPRPGQQPAATIWPALVERTVEVVDLPPRQDRALAPLGEVPHDRRLFVEALRELFGELGVSLRMFAARYSMDPSTVSRYLSGNRIPPRKFLELLGREASLRRGREMAPDTLRRLYALHVAALREALDDTLDRLCQSIELETALKTQLLSRQQALAKLEARLRELRGSRSPQSA
ncbi:helix-turn-helix domain-containing protein [Streptomyces sp. QH1-20]|uniref:helix-turn-helix domain-containing protein n=1 Tax=Streptomyces sp. QH1-20 TaxID=3240934 RepID=UPI003518BA1B